MLFTWSLYLCRRRPTLPHTFACSTIGPAGLDFRVRDGNGYFPRGKITGFAGVCETYLAARSQRHPTQDLERQIYERTSPRFLLELIREIRVNPWLKLRAISHN